MPNLSVITEIPQAPEQEVVLLLIDAIALDADL